MRNVTSPQRNSRLADALQFAPASAPAQKDSRRSASPSHQGRLHGDIYMPPKASVGHYMNKPMYSNIMSQAQRLILYLGAKRQSHHTVAHFCTSPSQVRCAGAKSPKKGSRRAAQNQIQNVRDYITLRFDIERSPSVTRCKTQLHGRSPLPRHLDIPTKLPEATPFTL